MDLVAIAVYLLILIIMPSAILFLSWKSQQLSANNQL